MKVFKRIMLVVAVLLAGVVVLVQLCMTSRKEALDSKQESTMALLERLGKLGDTGASAGDGTDTEPRAAGAEIEKMEEKTQAQCLPPLKRLPTRDEIAQHWESKQREHPVPARMLDVELGILKRVDGAIWMLTQEKNVDLTIGIGTMSTCMGDPEMARVYLREALEANTDLRVHKVICSRLAWAEDDPVVVRELLEQACAGDDCEDALVYVARLADVTGSVELRDRCLERLRRVNPGMAGQLDAMGLPL